MQHHSPGQRGPRAGGEQSRSTILRAAAALASTDGLEGLSIGNLASALGMTKSGLHAHFGSKQELQLATVEEAARIFAEEVVQPALAAPDRRVPVRLRSADPGFCGYRARPE
jgi:AcrR family transcriptional regulator